MSFDTMRSTAAGAPVLAGVRVESTLAPAVVMQHIIDEPLPTMFDRWFVFPAVVQVENLHGTWPQPDAKRRIRQQDGNTMVETIARFEPGIGHTYLLGEWAKMWKNLWDVVEDDWQFKPSASGGTSVVWTWRFHVTRARWAVRFIIAPLWQRNQRRMLTRALRKFEHETA